MRVHFQVLEETPPTRLVLKTGADGSFEGRYVAEFRAENVSTVGTFTEEATALGVLPKVVRWLFFNQRQFIAEHAQEAKAEIARRAADRSVEPWPPVESGAAAPQLPLSHEEEQREAE